MHLQRRMSFYIFKNNYSLFCIRVQYLIAYLRAAPQCVGILNTIVGILIYRCMKGKAVSQIFIISTVSRQHMNAARSTAGNIHKYNCI